MQSFIYYLEWIRDTAPEAFRIGSDDKGPEWTRPLCSRDM